MLTQADGVSQDHRDLRLTERKVCFSGSPNGMAHLANSAEDLRGTTDVFRGGAGETHLETQRGRRVGGWQHGHGRVVDDMNHPDRLV